MNPIQHPPTYAGLATAFLTALLTWAWAHVPEVVPAEVATTGYVLAVAVLGGLVGKFAERWTWADEKVQTEFISPARDDHGGLGS